MSLNEAQDMTKQAQNGPKMKPRAQDGSREAQDGRKMAPTGLKRNTNWPKMEPEGAKMEVKS